MRSNDHERSKEPQRRQLVEPGILVRKDCRSAVVASKHVHATSFPERASAATDKTVRNTPQSRAGIRAGKTSP